MVTKDPVQNNDLYYTIETFILPLHTSQMLDNFEQMVPFINTFECIYNLSEMNEICINELMNGIELISH